MAQAATTPKNSDPFAFWRASLRGEKPLIDVNTPQPGYYRKRRGRGGPWEPVLITLDGDGKPIARVGNDAVDVDAVWQWCADKPVPEAYARVAFETGKFPGELDDGPLTARIGDNSGDLTLEQEIADACEAGLARLRKVKIDSQEVASEIRNTGDKIALLAKKADHQRDVERRPHREAADAVQAKWKPWIEQAEDAARKLRDAADAWVKAENARIAKEHAERVARERAEAERVRREELERARKEAEEQGGSDLDVILAEPPEPAAPPPPPPPPPPKVMVGGQYGKRSAGKKVISYVIDDYGRALAALQERPEVRELVQKLVDRAGKAGIIIDGVRRVEE